MTKQAHARKKHIPMRSCIACRKSFPKRELIRLVYTPEGVQVDLTGKAAGRGAYICNQPECRMRAMNAKVLSDALRVSLTTEQFAALMQQLQQATDS